MKYILLTLLLSTQLFADEKNKPITIYGYVSEKENHYILKAHHIDKKDVKNTSFQLLFDNNKINIDIPKDKEYLPYKLQGVIIENKNKRKKDSTPYLFQVNSIQKIDSKIKAKNYLNTSRVKFLINNPMFGKVLAKKRKTNENYISNIKVKVNEKPIFNLNTSSCVGANPIFKFSYQKIKPSFLTLEYVDNYGNVKTNYKKVKYKNTKTEIAKVLKLSKHSKNYPNKIKSIKKLFGDITLIEDGIELTVAEIAENGGRIPIGIRSSLKFKSIALFIGVTENARYKQEYYVENLDVICGEPNGYSFAAQWFSTPYSIADFRLNIKMINSGEVLVVLEAENGKFYTVKKEVWVSFGGEGA